MYDNLIDKDPEYRATRVKSGIPPPSSRDQRRPYNQQRNNGDLSRFNPAMQRPQQRHEPYPNQRQREYQRPDDRYQRQDQRYPPPSQQQQYNDQKRYDQHSRYPDQRQPYPDHGDRQRQQGYSEQQRHQVYSQQQQQAYPVQRQQAPPPRSAPAPPAAKPKPLDMRTSTDFLRCENRISTEELIQTLHVSDASTDFDFLSSKGLVEKVNSLRVTLAV